MQNQQEETSSLLVHQQQDREPRRNDSFDDAATFESDLQELSNVDLLSKSMDSFREPQKKHVLLEDLFAFYSKLLLVLKDECAENSEYVSRFEDCYANVVGLLNVKLRSMEIYFINSINAGKATRSNAPLVNNLVLQSKNYLFKMYTKELILHQKQIYGEETSEMTERLVAAPFQHIFPEETPESPKEETASIADDDTLINNVNRREKQAKTWKTRVYEFSSTVLPWMKWHGFLQNIKGDIISGLTVGSLEVPQAMGYAMIAGLPPIIGLYTAFMPVLFYTFFASSRHLSVGPSAMLSLLVLTAFTQLKAKTLEEKLDYAMILALLAGIIQILVGILRLGFIVNLMSHPVLSGVIIALSQLKYILGIDIPDSKELQTLLLSMIKGFKEIHWITFGFGCLFIGMMVVLKYGCIKIRGKKYTLKLVPAPLVLVIVSTLLMVFIKAVGAPVEDDGHYVKVLGIKVVGTIHAGLPFIPRLPNWDLLFDPETFKQIFPVTLSVVLVGLLESISIAKYASQVCKYDLDANQEMIALGIGSITAAVFRGIPACGSFARTLVSVGVGGKSQLASVICASVVFITVMLLTPLFFYLPRCALSAIIIVSVLALMGDFIHEVMFTFKAKAKDCFLTILAFVATLVLSLELGIMVAVCISLALVIYRASRPRFVLLGRRPGTTHYSSLHWKSLSSMLIQVPGVLIGRLDSDLFFANVAYVRDRMKKFISKSQYTTHVFILDCSSVNQIDSSGILELKSIKDYMNDIGTDLYLAQVKENVMKVMTDGKIHEKIPPSHFFVDLHDSVLHAKHQIALKIETQLQQEQQMAYQSINVV